MTKVNPCRYFCFSRYCALIAFVLWMPLVTPLFAATLYVSPQNPNAAPPFSSWDIAATNIQDALNLAQPGDLVLATNGLYTSGGVAVFGQATNRVALTNAITLLSVNGPQVTAIVGATQLRCAYVGSNCVLSGFMLTNGGTRNAGDFNREQSGAGAWCETGAVITNCLFVSNNAGYYGGGVYGGSLFHCTIATNQTYWGGAGAYGSALSGCNLSGNFIKGTGSGGGAYGGSLSNCILFANSAYDAGGGSYRGLLYNCQVISNHAGYSGGGAYQAMLSNCSLTVNSASSGGGTYGSTNYSCVLSTNSAANGGGASGGLLYNCLLLGNVAGIGGGANGATLYNSTVVGNVGTNNVGGVYNTSVNGSIVYFNSGLGSNWSGGNFFYSCTAPTPPGADNVTSDPAFVDVASGDFRLLCGSPCIDSGFNYSPLYTNDIRGRLRPLDGNHDGILQFDMGAYEADSAVDLLVVIQKGFPFGSFAAHYPVPFLARFAGCPDVSWWDFGDGAVISNRMAVSHAWETPGTYLIQLSAGFATAGVVLIATTQVQVVTQPIYYVNASNPAPLPPYNTWARAATNIQDAIGISSVAGRLVLVTNGTTRSAGVRAGSSSSGTPANAALTNGVILQSVNGPAATTIWPLGGRCAYVGSNSILSGFSLLQGATSPGDDFPKGGGVWAEPGGLITNCILTGNRASDNGGGAYQGSFYNCIFGSNAAATGGGVDSGILYNCVFTNNTASIGGGASSSLLYQCTLFGNSATSSGAGLYFSASTNCIVWSNTIPSGLAVINWQGGTFGFSCTTPKPPGPGNINVSPLFQNSGAGNLRLHFGSPCIDAGNNLTAVLGTDIDGNLRPLDGNGDGTAAFDLGAYEFDLLSTVGTNWLIAHGLNPADPLVFVTDPDQDGLTTLQEWIADTDPTNAASRFRLAGVSNGPPAVVWFQSSSNRVYTLLSAADILAGYAVVSGQSNVIGNGALMGLTDTNSAGQRFYRARVSVP